VISDDIHGLLGIYPTGAPVPGNRVSKHRAGCAPKLTGEQQRKGPRDSRRAWQARKSAWLDAKILEAHDA
jgi:hypothetical protein